MERGGWGLDEDAMDAMDARVWIRQFLVDQTVESAAEGQRGRREYWRTGLMAVVCPLLRKVGRCGARQLRCSVM